MAKAVSRQAALVCALLAGCASVGPEALQQNRLQYNEIVKTTSEEQLLLNIVRLRYTDTPSSLSVSTIAAQFERSQSLQLGRGRPESQLRCRASAGGCRGGGPPDLQPHAARRPGVHAQALHADSPR